MTLSHLLSELARRDITLWPEGDHLRFRAPRGALTPELRDALVNRKLEVIAELRDRAGATATALPLSFGQVALWLQHQRAPASAAYHIGIAIRIRSTVDVGALRAALQGLVDRHATLRTTYAVTAEGPVQRVRGGLAARLDVVDVSGRTESDLAEDVATAYRQPFDLQAGPIARGHLFTRRADDHAFLFVIHHIAADGSSALLLLDELRTLYAAQAAGTASSLPMPTAQYSDFVGWQRELVDGPEGQRQLAYWRRRLAGDLPVLALPADRQRPRLPSYRGASHTFVLSGALTEQLKSLAQAEGTTLYATLLAGFQALLHRYSGQDDVIVGSPTFGRSSARFAEVVGHFVNLVSIRVDCGGNLSFRTLLHRTKDAVLSALEHQDYPFPLLVERLGFGRDPGRSPVFQAIFALQRLQRTDELAGLLLPGGQGPVDAPGGLRLEPMPLAQQEGQFDLVLEMVEVAGALHGSLKYSTDIFMADTIARMVGHLQTLLADAVRDPSRALSQLAILTDRERREILVDWNSTTLDYPRDTCIHRLVAAQAMRAPDALAVAAGARHLTYGELDRRANQLGRRLGRMGVGPGSLVGVCLERSVDLLVGILGVLKAGGAYVPLDPAYPAERLSFMIEDARMPVLLTHAKLEARLMASPARRLRLDADWPDIAQELDGPLDAGVTGADLAYVIYTSGSTGTPKGVELQHDGLVNLVTWHQHVYHVTPADRATLLAGLGFDASVWEVWPYLASGASLHIPAEETRIAPPRLLPWLASEGITLCFMATPLLEAALQLPWPSGLKIRAVLTGGDRLHRPPDRGLPFEVVNHYGPTETTVVATWQPVAPDSGGPPPIGRPIANTQAYVLDANLEPVPVGVAGELYLGGDGLARGYLNRPELTAERFIVHSLGDRNVRLYRSGDLVKYRPDGALEFIGRGDNQVKIRGFRIELGEIEAVLCRQPLVGEAVVVARDDGARGRQLVAYVTASHQPGPKAVALRDGLRAKLPDYMVPAFIVVLDALPLTENGKVARDRLPAPEPPLPPRQAQPGPRNEIERMLSRTWQEVLQVATVDVDDNFFDLGGHSLLLVAVQARLTNALGLDVSILDMFQYPTIRTLAAHLAQAPAARTTMTS